MSRRHPFRSSALAGSLVLALAGLPAPAAALADDATSPTAATPGTPEGSTRTSAPLELSDFAAVVVHEFADRIFYSSGAAGDTLLVTDLAGKEVGRLAGLPGPTGLTPGQFDTFWVAMARGHAIVEYDAQTLQVRRRVDLPPDQCPGDLAINGKYLVYGYSCIGYTGEGGTGGLGSSSTPWRRRSSGTRRRDRSCDPSSASATSSTLGRPPPSLAIRAPPQGPRRAPSTSAAAPPWSSRRSPSAAACRTWGSTTGTRSSSRRRRTRRNTRRTTCPRTASARTSLRASHSRPPEAPRALAWSAFTTRFATASVNAAGPDVVVHSAFQIPGSQTAGTAAFASFELGPDTAVEPGGLSMDAQGQRVFAVARDGAGRLALHTFTLPSGMTATITGPASAYAGNALTLTGRITFADGEVPVGEYVSVERSVATPTGVVSEWLPPVRTDTTGSFTITDTPTAAGPTTYTVCFDRGEYVQARTTASWKLDVRAKAPAVVDVTGPLTAPVGRELRLTGTVSHPDGSSPAGGTVTVERYAGTGSAVTLPPVTVTPNGAFAITDTPSATGQIGYVATYNGTGHTGSGPTFGRRAEEDGHPRGYRAGVDVRWGADPSHGHPPTLGRDHGRRPAVTGRADPERHEYDSARGDHRRRRHFRGRRQALEHRYRAVRRQLLHNHGAGRGQHLRGGEAQDR